MSNISIPYNWKPRPYQMEFWEFMRSGGKRAALCWHRRSGKDDISLHVTAVKAFKRVGSYWHMMPKVNQCRKAMWNGINHRTGKTRVEDAFPKAITKHLSQEMMVKFCNGSNWSLRGSDNYDNEVGAGPVGLIFSEYALANPAAWSFFQPMLLENNGYAIFISTPRGKNHFYQIMKNNKHRDDFFTQSLTVEDTGLFNQAQLDEAYQELYNQYGDSTIADSLFQQEYYCSFDAAILGAIYAGVINKAEQEKRISETYTLFDKDLPVFTSWDLGFGDSTVIWFFQIVLGEIRFIDYYEESGKSVKDLVEVLAEKGRNHGYRYKDYHHYFPHDGLHKLQAAGGKSIVEQFDELGVKGRIIPSTTKANTIAAGRLTIGRSYFGMRTADGLEKMRSYRYKWNDNTKSFSTAPVHDFTSHAADGFGIAGRVWTQDKIVVEQSKPQTIIDMAKAYKEGMNARH